MENLIEKFWKLHEQHILCLVELKCSQGVGVTNAEILTFASKHGANFRSLLEVGCEILEQDGLNPKVLAVMRALDMSGPLS